MSTYKHFNRICLVTLSFILLLTALFMNAKNLGVPTVSAAAGYESRLFDTASVHSIDIVMDDWDGFLDTCTDEEYVPCAVVIDGEAYRNVGLRAKGNTSLTQVAAYGNDRYSFKIEFDHYEDGKTYYGLDKLCLNNVIQDNTYMKEFFSYRIMAEAGAPAPLCSYVNISVNGEPWGLYLAVEGIEEAFLTRNYGTDYGELYKPDSTDMGGGNAKGFEAPSELPEREAAAPADTFSRQEPLHSDAQDESLIKEAPGDMQGNRNGGQGLMGDSDVLLQYTDDETDSYPNIFDNAKTEVSETDKTRLIEALKKLSGSENLESTVDTDSVIRYFTAHNFVLNFDSYTGSIIHNYYLYEENGKLSMLPWDYNLSFGGFQSAGGTESLINYPIDTPVSGGSVSDRPMLAWIFSDEAYTELYHQYFSKLLSEYFESGSFAEEIDFVTSMISPYVEEDPTKFCTYEDFECGAATLKEFCLLRAKSIRGQLDGTIGRTDDTQDPDTLIQAENMVISDMGSMEQNHMSQTTAGVEVPENGNMPEMPQNDDIPEVPQDGDMPEVPQDGGMPEMTENDKPQDRNGRFGGQAVGDGSPAREAQGQPGGFDNSPQEASPAAPILLTALSLAVLLGGLLFALLFKPRI